MAQKDLSEKNLEAYPDVFADTVNALLYQGEQIVCAENLQSAPTETFYKSNGGRLRNQFHDVSKYEMHHNKIKMQYTLENETSIKRKIILRKAGYEGAIYREQYDRKGVFPFISILLYWGKRRWNAPQNLIQLFGCEIPDKSRKFMDTINLHVYEMAHLPKKVRKCFRSDMRIVVDYLAEGKAYIPSQQKILHLEALLLMLKALTGDDRYREIIPDVQKIEKERGGISMCELIDKYENRGVARGVKQGRVEMLFELVRDGLLSLTDAAKRVSLTEREFFREMKKAGY